MHDQNSSQQGPRDELLLSLTDLWDICKKSRRTILLSALALPLFLCFTLLRVGIVYEADAKFKEREIRSAGISSSFSDMLGLGGKSKAQSEADSLMHSRPVLDPIVKDYCLQAYIGDPLQRTGRLRRLLQHFKTEWASMSRRKTPCFSDPSVDISCAEVEYEGEFPKGLLVKFTDDSHYDVHSSRDEFLGSCALGQRFEAEEFLFTLNKTQDSSLRNREFSVSLCSLDTASKSLGNALQIDDKEQEDPSLLHLLFVHPNRHLSAELLNRIMEEYQGFLKKDADRKGEIQLAYLRQRQVQCQEELHEQLLLHADSISNDLTVFGFAKTDTEMAFLSQIQKELKQKKMLLDLEQVRVRNALQVGPKAYEKFICGGEPALIQQALCSIRTLKSQRDSLDLALYQEGPSNDKLSESGLTRYLEIIHSLDSSIDEAYMVLDCLRSGQPMPPASTLASVPKFLQQSWENSQQASTLLKLQKPQNDLRLSKEQFESYLENMIRTKQIHRDSIEQRIAYQKESGQGFEGVDLQTIKSLFTGYHSKLQELESTLQQQGFALQQMADPEVDLTCLGPVLNDPISRELITQSHQLRRLLQDEGSRSAKEQARIHHQLGLGRQFLTEHLEQSIGMNEESRLAILSQLQNLRRLSLDLIHQEISLKEKQFTDYLSSRDTQIQHEQELLAERSDELNADLARLPRKWVSDRLLEQQVAQHQRVLEEVTRLVESKNITHNLEFIQSCPIEYAIPPVLPKSSKLLFQFITATVMGSIMGLSYVLIRAVAEGMPASENSLGMQGYRCLGNVRCNASSLPTARRACEFVLEGTLPNIARVAFLAEQQEAPYSCLVSELLGRRDLRVCRVPLEGPESPSSDGLLHYLKGDIEFPKLVKGIHYDQITAGGYSEYATEFLRSARFQALIEDLKSKYDIIVLSTLSTACSAECEALLTTADVAIVTISDEKIDAISTFQRWKSRLHLGFVFNKS